MGINKIVKVKQKKSKNTPFVSIEKVTEKLKGPDRTQMLHSIARWEFLRRNNEFKNEINTLNKMSENNIIKVFGEKTLDEEIENESEVYAQQMISYLRSYTKGNLNARVMKTNKEGVFDILREIIFRG